MKHSDMRSFSVALLTVFLTCSATVVDAQVTQSDIQEFFESRRAKTVKIQPLVIQFDESNNSKFIKYSPPALESDLSLNDPLLDSVVQAQASISLIRKNQTQPNVKRFWEPVLRSADREISASMKMWAKGDLTEEQAAKETERLTGAIEDTYYSYLDVYAKQNAYPITKHHNRVFDTTFITNSMSVDVFIIHIL